MKKRVFSFFCLFFIISNIYATKVISKSGLDTNSAILKSELLYCLDIAVWDKTDDGKVKASLANLAINYLGYADNSNSMYLIRFINTVNDKVMIDEIAQKFTENSLYPCPAD